MMMDDTRQKAGTNGTEMRGLELTPLSQPGEMTAMDRFIFESWGYLIIPDVLSEAECDEALEACKRVASNYKGNMAKLKKFKIEFYALNKNGEYGAAALWGYSVNARGERRRGHYAVHDGRENKLREVAYLYESPDK